MITARYDSERPQNSIKGKETEVEVILTHYYVNTYGLS